LCDPKELLRKIALLVSMQAPIVRIGPGAEDFGVQTAVDLIPLWGLVDDRQRDEEADAVDGEERNQTEDREQDLAPRFGHLDDRQQLFHVRSSPLEPSVDFGRLR
jgi:hypothetical protein